MAADESIDLIDKQILQLIQADARATATELAAHADVSDSTVHSRIDRLEAEGVITGYHARIDHDQVGLSLHVLYSCTADIHEREACVEEILEISAVVNVVELLTGEENLLVQVVCSSDEDVAAVSKELRTIGVQIHDETLIRSNHSKPIDVLELET